MAAVWHLAEAFCCATAITALCCAVSLCVSSLRNMVEGREDKVETREGEVVTDYEPQGEGPALDVLPVIPQCVRAVDDAESAEAARGNHDEGHEASLHT